MSSGITLEAGHASLKDIIDEAENAKVKRSMYAETQRQKMEVLDAIRNSEWNTEMNPTVVTQQEVPVFHDFSKGFVLAHRGPSACLLPFSSRPIHIPITFTIRNYSTTHISRFVFRVVSDSISYLP
jgi:hypothetical protein